MASEDIGRFSGLGSTPWYTHLAAGIVEVDHPQCPPPEGGLAEPGDHFLDLRQSRIKPLVPSDVLICFQTSLKRQTGHLIVLPTGRPSSLLQTESPTHQLTRGKWPASRDNLVGDVRHMMYRRLPNALDALITPRNMIYADGTLGGAQDHEAFFLRGESSDLGDSIPAAAALVQVAAGDLDNLQSDLQSLDAGVSSERPWYNVDNMLEIPGPSSLGPAVPDESGLHFDMPTSAGDYVGPTPGSSVINDGVAHCHALPPVTMTQWPLNAQEYVGDGLNEGAEIPGELIVTELAPAPNSGDGIFTFPYLTSTTQSSMIPHDSIGDPNASDVGPGQGAVHGSEHEEVNSPQTQRDGKQLPAFGESLLTPFEILSARWEAPHPQLPSYTSSEVIYGRFLGRLDSELALSRPGELYAATASFVLEEQGQTRMRLFFAMQKEVTMTPRVHPQHSSELKIFGFSRDLFSGVAPQSSIPWMNIQSVAQELPADFRTHAWNVLLLLPADPPRSPPVQHKLLLKSLSTFAKNISPSTFLKSFFKSDPRVDPPFVVHY
ncbi:hypothetical protein B0H14DRAFT_3139453 [Mycena olivaceomarginata]|nr:hypothetical protein B0H14DRAFT_3139453 [Mycena olivaceomarginata]